MEDIPQPTVREPVGALDPSAVARGYSPTARLVVAGVGTMGMPHARNAVASPRAELVAVADADTDRAVRAGQELGVPGYDDVAKMLSAHQPDGLIVATPAATHTALIQLAAKCDVHVFCEKPLSYDGPPAAEAVAAAEHAGIKMQLGFQMRFDRDFSEVADLIAGGKLGQLYQFRASIRDPVPHSREYLQSSGGFFWDGAIHFFDLARWLMGEIEEVSAFGATLSDPMFEELGDVDNAMVVLRFASGALGLVEMSRVAGYGFESGIEVLGAEATCRVTGSRASGVDLYEPGTVRVRHVRDFLERFEPAYATELEGFLDVILSDAAPRVDGRDGLAAMRICQAAVTSFHTGRTTSLSSVDW